MRSAVFFAAAMLAGQQPEPLTLRTTTRLVEVSLVAHDAKGRAVADLSAEDIEVLERGRPQKILRFVREEPPAASTKP
ncbi:MAG TPA: hypothetical protein DEH78_12530, partial [Solibacterales bacterium]|nr:hypothetical protein [Bryobacterales bacterium]